MAKCFEVTNGAVREGIALNADGKIAVGESGRSRSLTIVNPPAGAEIRDNRLISVPGTATVVLIRDHSGYRGSWSLRQYAEGRCPLDGQLVGAEHKYVCPYCGDDLYGAADGVKHAAAPGLPIKATDLGKVIAEGRCAQGDAGRMGGGPEYLLALRPGTRFSIQRLGRLYGAPGRLNVEIAEDGTPVLTDAWAAIKAAEADAAWEEQ